MARNIGLKIPFSAVWERVRIVTGWHKDKELATFLEVKPGTISGARQRDSFPIQWAFKIAQEFNCNTDWLMTGTETGQTAPEPGINDNLSPGHALPFSDIPVKPAAQFSADVINVQALLNMTAEVLVTETVYRAALAANIKAFHRSVRLESDTEKRWIELENRLIKLEKENNELRRQQPGEENRT